MRRLLWILLFVSCTLFAFWTVLGPWTPRTNLAVSLVLLFFFVHPVGAFWMLYYSIRHEERPWPFIFLACLPYAFVWYYFERVRTGKALRSVSPAPARDA